MSKCGPSPIGWYTYLVLYRTAKMASGVRSTHSVVDTKPVSRAALKQRIRELKKFHGWSEVLGVWEECYRKVEL